MNNPYFQFKVIHQSKKSRARVGQIITPHGIIDTPNFVPVGTNGAMKGVDALLLEQCNVQLMFCNTYHLMLQPGADIVEKAGGLHQFMHRTQPLITDSGGFQVFSLMYGGVASEIKSKGNKSHNNSIMKITEEGVTFRSYRDGQLIKLTPETSIQAQKKIGADIILSFDELPPYHIDAKALKRSFDRTHRWEERSLIEHKKNPNNQALYSIVHGGIDPELRKTSVELLKKLDFDGFAIGGSVGKNREEMVQMLQNLMPHMPYDKPNHLLGIADLPSIHQSIPLGIDTFDSSHPSKCARHGKLFTENGDLNILRSGNNLRFEPISATCECYTCQNYTIAYLHHLFKAHELSAYTLATIHNVFFITNLMKKYRESILNDKV
jgi:queuine tRNA-ribosyltransferase